MENLFIPGTPKSPEIDFRAEGRLRIAGVSVLEDAFKFYRKPVKWVEEYILQPAQKTIVELDMKFFSTSSQVSIFEMLMKLATLKRSGYDVIFNWYYADDDIKELGEDIANLLGINFNYIKKQPE